MAIPHEVYSLVLNTRELTEDDLWRICQRVKIKVIDTPLSVRGYYTVTMGRPYIYL